jgi:hypothetical protein
VSKLWQNKWPLLVLVVEVVLLCFVCSRFQFRTMTDSRVLSSTDLVAEINTAPYQSNRLNR